MVETVPCTFVREPVSVRRDGRGVPYVEARSQSDLFCAQGYVAASDRLWQMDLFRRTARGELAEILGSAALDQDKHFRTYGFTAITEAGVDKLAPEVRAAYDAYAAGVNAFISGCPPSELPLEFQLLGYEPRPWTVSDSLAVGKILAEALATSWPNDLIRTMFVDVPRERRDRLFGEISPLDVVIVGTDALDRRGRAAVARRFAAAEKRAVPPDRVVPTHPVVKRETLPDIVARKRARAAGLRRVGMYASQRAMSNNWVVSGRHTDTSKPLLANDPHLSPAAPGVWYLAHLRCEDFAAAGATTPGVPGIMIGHNDRIAWGSTNLGGDIQDLYREEFDPADPTRYRTPDGWEQAIVRVERINVRRGLEGPEVDVVDFPVRVTGHGPVVVDQPENVFALRWASLDASANELEAFYWINRARSWDEFRDALRRFTGPPQNFVYADVDGNIGHAVAGCVPLRRRADVGLPHEGTGPHRWHGYLSIDKLPHVFNPESGVIATANNRIVGRDYPYTLTRDWRTPYRARRIVERIQSGTPNTVDQSLAVQADTFSYADAIFARTVVEIAKAQGDAAPEWHELVQRFEGWDARSEATSRVMPLAAAMRDAFARRVLVAALGQDRADSYMRWPSSPIFVDFLVEDRPAEWLPADTPSYDALLLAAYRDAKATLTAKAGADETQWEWGRIADPIVFLHPLAGVPNISNLFAVAPMPQHTGGGGTTVNAGAFVSMRLIVDLSDWDNTRQGLALGQSGDPRSPHWADQLEDWRKVAPAKLPFTESAIASATVRHTLLVPTPDASGV